METMSFFASSQLDIAWLSAFSPALRRDAHQWSHPSWMTPRRSNVTAVDPRGLNLRATRRTKAQGPSRILTSVPVRVAHELAQAGHRYLDVRTPDEFSAGHPSGAVNVPYMYRVGSGLIKNPGFLRQVSSHFRKHDEIIIGSESGERSLTASVDLLSSGFTAVTNIAGGYTTWSQNGLPVEE